MNKINLIKTLAGSMMAALLACGPAACGADSLFGAKSIGDLVGGDAGHVVKAAGRAMNSLALSEKDEDALGQSVGVRLTNEYHLVNDPKLQKYVALVGLTVASASSEPGKSYVFGVLDTPNVNAFSGPNGYIFVTKGALALMQDEAELAGVLAHEVAHVVNHDGLHQVQAAERRGALSELAQANSQSAQFSALADAGADIITKQGYSQPQEFAADDMGVRITSAAGYDPRSYLGFLQRMAKAQSGGDSGALLSTHPGASKRVGRVNTQVTKMPAGGATLADRFAAHVAK